MNTKSPEPTGALTRRHFLTRVAAAGGASLVYEAMTGLGLLAAPTQAPFGLTGRVSGARVVILGAGLAGMTAAYELGKVGYDCRVLEARSRPGGRVFTVRRGTVSEEDGPSQTAAFDDGLYFNAGPMRISHHHHTTLAYCRELRVPVEVFVADSESAYLYQTRSSTLTGRRIRLREARADFDGRRELRFLSGDRLGLSAGHDAGRRRDGPPPCGARRATG